MPRNAQGLYTLPSGNPVISGTEIESVWANTTMDDLAAALTASLPRDGSAPMTGPLTLNGQLPTNARHAVDKSYVDGFIAFATGMPIGAITAYGGAMAPPGWLLCDGSAVNRALYSDLFIALGTTYGAGDGSTTFNLPDLRNEFIRGRPASRAVGNKQAAAFAAHVHAVSDPGHAHGQAAHGHSVPVPHTHGVTDPGHSHAFSKWEGNYSSGQNANGNPNFYILPQNTNTGASGTGVSIQTATPTGVADQQSPAIAAAATGVSLGASGGDETRPQNMALDYYIKAVQDSSGPVPITGIDTSDPEMISVDNTTSLLFTVS